MNELPPRVADPDGAIVQLVAFKWLMAGRGWWIDLARLRRDKAYADVCIRRAVDSGSPSLCRQGMAVLPLLERAAATAA
jgi:hypothetical protein